MFAIRSPIGCASSAEITCAHRLARPRSAAAGPYRRGLPNGAKGAGLLMVWSDTDAEFETEFNRWYDEEHVPRLLQVPGFLSAGR